MWIYVPKGCCPSAPEPGSSTSDSKWRSHLLASSATLSTKHTRATSWLRALKMKPWTTRLFGRIFTPSTAALGVERWTASLEAILASPSVLPAKGSPNEIPATSGPGSGSSSESSTPGGASSRTSPDTSTAVSERSWAISKLSDSAWSALTAGLRSEYSARRKSARATAGRDSSSWPTALNHNDRGGPSRSAMEKKGGADLGEKARRWPTPNCAPESLQLGSNQVSSSPCLGEQAECWPSPAARDYRTPNTEESERRRFSNGREKSGHQLQNFVAHSPQVRVISIHGAELSPTDPETISRRRLNPAFVCWLMGWPWWWTNPAPISFARSAMASYLSRLRMLLGLLPAEPSCYDVDQEIARGRVADARREVH